MSDIAKPSTNNAFTPAIRARAKVSLIGMIEHEIYVMSLPGQGEERYIIGALNSIQRHLRTLLEFGFEDVALLDEKKYPTLCAEIGPLKRAGLKEEIAQIMRGELKACNVPQLEGAEKK